MSKNNMEMNQDLNRLINLITIATDSIKDLIYIVKYANGVFTYYFANQTGLAFLNENQDIIGKSFDEVVEKERADVLNEQYMKAYETKRVVTYEDEVVMHDSKYIFETMLTPITSDGEDYIIAVVRDVTEKVMRMKELEHSKRLLEENSSRLSSLSDNNEDAVIMLDLGGKLLEVNPATEKLIGFSNVELTGIHFSQLVENEILITKYFQQALLGKTVRFETVIYHKDGNEINVSIKNIPIIIKDQIRGVYAIIRNITSEKQTEEKFQKITNRLNSLVNDGSDAIFTTDMDGYVEYVNRAFTEIFGFTEDEVLHKKENPIVPDWLKNEADEMYNRVRNGEKVQDIHVQYQRKTGELLDMSVTLSPINDEFGNVTGISCICRDITENQKNVKELLRIKQQLELVWNHSTDAILIIGHDGRIIRANPAFEQIFGWKAGDQEKLLLADIYLDQQKNQLDEIFSRLRTSEEKLRYNTQRKSKDGQIIDVDATYTPVNKGEVLTIIHYKNITNDKNLIQSMKKSEERHRKIIDIFPMPVLFHDGKKIVYLNKAGLNLLKAINLSQVTGRPVLDFIPPEDHEMFHKQIELMIKESNQGNVHEQRLLTVYGNIIYAEISTILIPDHEKPLFSVMIRDMTNRKRSEQALRESEERFRIIAEHSRDIIEILDLEGIITYASPSMEETLGHPIRNVIGKDILSQIHPEDVETVREKLDRMLQTKQQFDVEVRHMHQDGHAMWLHSFFKPILSENEDIEKFILISSDISEAKQKEERLTRMAFTDYLTGLPNRRLFNERLNQAMITSDRTGKLTALMLFDSDKLKQINDTLGHDMGDEVIKEIGNRVRSILRKKDTISRIGGDEFTIVLPEMKGIDDIKKISERILEVINQPMFIKGQKIQITLSIGVSIYPFHAGNANDLFKDADKKLYQSKSSGGNRYTI